MADFEKDDVLHFSISDESEAGSVEISPNITAELNEYEDLKDLRAAKAEEADSPAVPLSDVRKELDI